MLAKSKLNSIKTLISQALIDFEISHEEFKIIVNEKKVWKNETFFRMMNQMKKKTRKLKQQKYEWK